MYNISMLSRDQVLALINEENGLTLTFEQVEFDLPIISSGAEDRDTELVITGIPNSGYRGTRTVHYNRIDLSEFLTLVEGDDAELILQVEGEVTLEKILTSFNEYFNSNLQLNDLRDDLSVPNAIEDGVDFSLIANANSYAYRGTLTLRLQPADVDLSTAIASPILNGLQLNLATEG